MLLEPFNVYVSTRMFRLIATSPVSSLYFLQVLKKAQRDAGSSRGEIIEHFKQTLTSEIEDVFRKFRANVMEAGDEEGLEVRKHYLKVRPEIALTEIGEKFRLLMTFFQPANKSEKRRQQRISYAIEVIYSI